MMARPGTRLGRSTRLGLLALAIALAGLLVTARGLTPDARGYGTHEQLGLSPCAFYRLTGTPCPSCGMTTAFAWTVRGRFDRAWGANPAGALLAPACAALTPWLLVGAARGKALGFRSPEPALIGVVVATVAVSLVSWTIRLILSG